MEGVLIPPPLVALHGEFYLFPRLTARGSSVMTEHEKRNSLSRPVVVSPVHQQSCRECNRLWALKNSFQGVSPTGSPCRFIGLHTRSPLKYCQSPCNLQIICNCR